MAFYKLFIISASCAQWECWERFIRFSYAIFHTEYLVVVGVATATCVFMCCCVHYNCRWHLFLYNQAVYFFPVWALCSFFSFSLFAAAQYTKHKAHTSRRSSSLSDTTREYIAIEPLHGRKLFRVFTNFFPVYSFYSHFYTCTLCTFFNENIYMLDTSSIKMKRMRQQKWTNILLRVNCSISNVWWNMRRSCRNGNLCIFFGSIFAGSCVCIYVPLCSNENRRIEMDDAGPIFVCHCCHYFWASCKQLLYHIWHLVSIPYANVVYK